MREEILNTNLKETEQQLCQKDSLQIVNGMGTKITLQQQPIFAFLDFEK